MLVESWVLTCIFRLVHVQHDKTDRSWNKHSVCSVDRVLPISRAVTYPLVL